MKYFDISVSLLFLIVIGAILSIAINTSIIAGELTTGNGIKREHLELIKEKLEKDRKCVRFNTRDI